MQREAMVRCIQKDNKGRVWVTTKEDATVRLLDNGGNELDGEQREREVKVELADGLLVADVRAEVHEEGNDECENEPDNSGWMG